MEHIEARPRFKWDIFWWMVIAAFLAFGMAGCGAAHPEPTGDGNVTDVQEDESDQTEGLPGNPGNSGNEVAGTAATAEDAKTTLNAELDEFFAGDVDTLDAPTIEQLDEQGLLTPEVIAAWTSGMNFKVGEATMDGTDKATVDATITCRPLGEAYNAQGGMNPDVLAEEISQVEPKTSEIQVEMQLHKDGEWEPTAAGYEALSSALIGTLAK